jgi:hypothetical protein
MALTFQYADRVPKSLKLRRALALPLYAVALVLSSSLTELPTLRPCSPAIRASDTGA